MKQFIPTTLADLFNYSTATFPQKLFTSFVDGKSSYTYGQFGEKVAYTSDLLTRHGICAGDKVIILSENMPNYSVAIFAATAFGRVMVPVLPDSSANEVNNIIVHSQAKAIFASAPQLAKISQENLDKLSLAVNITTFETFKEEPCQQEGRVKVPHQRPGHH